MATAFAERERTERGLDIDIVTGGTDPAEDIHETVIDAMQERDIDISDRTPRKITPDDIEGADYVVTMGCSVDEFRPPDWTGESQRWDLEHPGGDDVDAVRDQRDEIERHVTDLFDEIEST
jgi:protein-tyrosine-phosphatase